MTAQSAQCILCTIITHELWILLSTVLPLPSVRVRARGDGAGTLGMLRVEEDDISQSSGNIPPPAAAAAAHRTGSRYNDRAALIGQDGRRLIKTTLGHLGCVNGTSISNHLYVHISGLWWVEVWLAPYMALVCTDTGWQGFLARAAAAACSARVAAD